MAGCNLPAAQALADLHLWRFKEEDFRGHFWNAGYVTWHRFAGCPEFEAFLRHHIERETHLHNYGWGRANFPTAPATVFGYLLDGDDYYLRRLAGLADLQRWAVFNGAEPEYCRGVYLEGNASEVSIAANAPSGVYTVHVNGSRRLPFSPVDTPEVFVPGDGHVDRGGNLMQYWFMVPEGEDAFWIEWENIPFFRQMVRQVVIWDADGREVWAHREIGIDHDADRKTIRADITVPRDQAGRLWRVTLPGERTMPFRLSPNLPARLAVEPNRWFDPGAVEPVP